MGERVILRTWDNCLEERQRMYFFILESQEINVSIPITVWYEIEKGSFVGVPKHFELEPDYWLLKEMESLRKCLPEVSGLLACCGK